MGVAMKRNKFWACPFFKWDGKQEISCEGGRVTFPTSESANAYMNAYCAGDWQKCSVAAALLKYYETEEENREKRWQDQSSGKPAGARAQADGPAAER